MSTAVQEMLDFPIPPEDAAFMADALRSLTTEQIRLKISEWAEQKRYLPPELTAKPGKWKNDFTPYLVEPMDCLGPTHPARKVAVMKGAQIGATTGLLEMFVGYTVDHDPAGMIYISADAELTKLGMELKIDRMLYHSGLQEKLGSADGSKKKSGDTSVLKQFHNGFLFGCGAQNPGKLRSTSAKKMALDELDGMPIILGAKGKEEGDPITVSEKRTDNYESTRKILYISTPLIEQTSLIKPLFMAGDQRHYFVPCVHCGHFQILRWHGITEGGKGFGFVWDLDDNKNLVTESVGYVCENCSCIFYNHDKSNFLKRGEWRPQAETTEEGLVSFHIPSFLSPVGMYPWKSIVYKWLKAWDVGADRMRDREKYQAFKNLEEGKAWEERGESPKKEKVKQHRRSVYSEGHIPNKAAVVETGAPIVLLTCAVDVHKDRLDVEVVGWCQDRQSYSISWDHSIGDPDDLSATGPWEFVRSLIKHTYQADDGRCYMIQVTVIDVSWAEKADAVYSFCNEWARGVFPVMGRQRAVANSLVKEFQQGESQSGNVLYNVNTTMYKDRLAAWLKPEWWGDGLQPAGYPNYPNNRPDEFFDQYESEHKIAIIQAVTKKRMGYEWKQIGQRANHAWDCRVYAMAALDMIVFEVCLEVLQMGKASHDEFFNYVTPKKNSAGQWMPTNFSWHPEQVAA